MSAFTFQLTVSGVFFLVGWYLAVHYHFRTKELEDDLLYQMAMEKFIKGFFHKKIKPLYRRAGAMNTRVYLGKYKEYVSEYLKASPADLSGPTQRRILSKGWTAALTGSYPAPPQLTDSDMMILRMHIRYMRWKLLGIFLVVGGVLGFLAMYFGF